MFNDIYIKSKPNFSISEFEREIITSQSVSTDSNETIIEEKKLEKENDLTNKVGIQTLTIPQEQNPIPPNIRLKIHKNNKPQFKTRLYSISDIKKQEENKKSSTIHDEEEITITNETSNDQLIIFSPLNSSKEEIKEFLNQFPKDNDKKFLQFIEILNPLYKMARVQFNPKIKHVTKEDGLNRNKATKAIKNFIDILIEQEKYQFAKLLLEKCVLLINTRFQIFIKKTYEALILKSPATAREFEKYCDNKTSNEEIKRYIREKQNCVVNQKFSITNEKGFITIKNF